MKLNQKSTNAIFSCGYHIWLISCHISLFGPGTRLCLRRDNNHKQMINRRRLFPMNRSWETHLLFYYVTSRLYKYDCDWWIFKSVWYFLVGNEDSVWFLPSSVLWREGWMTYIGFIFEALVCGRKSTELLLSGPLTNRSLLNAEHISLVASVTLITDLCS